MKKYISLILVVILLLSFNTSLYGEEKKTSHMDKYMQLVDDGIFDIISVESPDESSMVTSQRALRSIAKMLNWEVSEYSSTTFSDVDKWAVPFVEYARLNGITSGISNSEFGKDIVDARRVVTWFLSSYGMNKTDIYNNTQKYIDKFDLRIDLNKELTYGNFVEFLYDIKKNDVKLKKINEEVSYISYFKWIDNGEYKIPSIITIPKKNDNKRFPIIIMNHGTGSNKDEAGNGYKMLAPKLAEKGIASIRFDFIGTGDSKVDYIKYSFKTAISDTNKVIDYAISMPTIDKNNIGLLGWSQGGTISLLTAAQNESVKSVVTWAGAVNLANNLIDDDGYKKAKKDGYSILEFGWRPSVKLGLEWYEDVLKTDVLDEISKSKASILAINGSDDNVVLPINAEKIAEASKNEKSKFIHIKDADHTFKIFTGNLEKYEELAKATINWFVEDLQSCEMIEEISVKSRRNVDIPVLISVPCTKKDTYPVVYLFHGHGGNAQQDGGFLKMLNSLSQNGIMGVSINFSGTGKSTEKFTDYNLDNMQADIDDVMKQVNEKYNVDKNKLGLLGYSMGGRIGALQLGADSKFNTAVFWAPAVDNGLKSLYNFLGGKEKVAQMYSIAKKEGNYLFTNPWGVEQDLGIKYFKTIEETNPLDNIKQYKGNILFISGKNDDIILPEQVQNAYELSKLNSQSSILLLDDMDHGFGIYNSTPNDDYIAIDPAVEFFVKKLK